MTYRANAKCTICDKWIKVEELEEEPLCDDCLCALAEELEDNDSPLA